MEQHFSREKHELRNKGAKARVSSQIRIKGPYILKQNYVGKEEVQGLIHAMPGSYDHEAIRKGLEELAQRRYAESSNWRIKLGGKSMIEHLYEKNQNIDGI